MLTTSPCKMVSWNHTSCLAEKKHTTCHHLIRLTKHKSIWSAMHIPAHVVCVWLHLQCALSITICPFYIIKRNQILMCYLSIYSLLISMIPYYLQQNLLELKIRKKSWKHYFFLIARSSAAPVIEDPFSTFPHREKPLSVWADPMNSAGLLLQLDANVHDK